MPEPVRCSTHVPEPVSVIGCICRQAAASHASVAERTHCLGAHHVCSTPPVACSAVEVRTWDMQSVGKETAAFHPSPRGRFANHLHRVLRSESRKPYWDNIDTRPEATRPLSEKYGKATDLIITNFHTGTDFEASTTRGPSGFACHEAP